MISIVLPIQSESRHHKALGQSPFRDLVFEVVLVKEAYGAILYETNNETPGQDL